MKVYNFKKIIFIALIIFTVFSVCNIEEVYAASGSASAKVNKESLNIGGTATLTVTATNSAIWYNITSSDSSVVSVSSTSGEIDSEYEQSKSATYTLTAKKAGSATITVRTYAASGYDGNEFSYSKSFTIKVTAPTPSPTTNPTSSTTTKPTTQTTPDTRSSDASLKLITVGDKTYTSPGTIIAASTVEYGTSSIKISAQTNNSKAKVTGTGTKELSVGTNKFVLKVTAENGQTKSYTVTVTRLAEEDVVPNVIDETEEGERQEEEEREEVKVRLEFLYLEGVELSPKFDSEIFEYFVNIVEMEEIKIAASANIEDARIEISGNKELVEGENKITIKVIKDETEVEYIINVHKESVNEIKEETDDEEEKIGFIGSIRNWWNTSGPITFTCSVIVILLGSSITFAILAYKYSHPGIKASRHYRVD